MTEYLQTNWCLLPVAALSFCQLDCLYLLAGVGPYLKIFNYESEELLRTEDVFECETVHGIVCRYLPKVLGGDALVLIWGGRSVSIWTIRSNLDVNGDHRVESSCHVLEVQLDDWILDASFGGGDDQESSPGNQSVNALLITAHNEVYELSINFGDNKSEYSRATHTLFHVASGPSSILYSAHVIWHSGGCPLIAAGTVFGEVLLWSFNIKQSKPTGSVCFYNTFIGHEGSVFGVRISDFGEDRKRLLASCSDDRTIRIWDIEESALCSSSNATTKTSIDRDVALLGGQNTTGSSGCLAVIMGHASRIWGLRFLPQSRDFWELMSQGEDGTAQIWRLEANGKASPSAEARTDSTYKLSHQTTFSYHSGKNLWAIAIYRVLDVGYMVASGGADGSIVTYKPDLHDSRCTKDVRSLQSSMEEAAATIRDTANQDHYSRGKHEQTTTKRIFDGLQGRWKLTRMIDSQLTTFPSGKFKGSAFFEQRSPSDEAFSAEYLYSEYGEFVTNAGVSMKAKRQYAYRYDQKNDVITTWFVKADDGSTVEYYFHTLDFHELQWDDQVNGNTGNMQEMTAGGYHLCGEDEYIPSYTFPPGGSRIDQWSVSFKVLGPKKDFTTQAIYVLDVEVDDLNNGLSNMYRAPRNEPTHGLRNGKENLIRMVKPDAFKTYSWVSKTEFLATTHAGNLLVGKHNTKQNIGHQSSIIWEFVAEEALLESSCIATSLPSLGAACLTGSDGTVFRYEHSTKTLQSIYKLRGKAGFLRAHAISTRYEETFESRERDLVGVITACLGIPKAIVLESPSNRAPPSGSAKETDEFKLPSNFIVTSSCFADRGNMIFLGSRSGDIAIYPLGKLWFDIPEVSESQQVYKVHGQEAVTVIENIPAKAQNDNIRHILTAGRDGTYSIHRILYHDFNNPDSQISLQTLHTGHPPFGPNIEGAHISPSTLHLWGFRGKEFVVWNETQKTETMTVNCGGAHRNWAYSHDDDGSGGGRFVYTKASICHLHTQEKAIHQVFQQGGHGREIKAMALSPPNIAVTDGEQPLRLLATGAEDTAIRLFNITSNEDEEPKCLHVLTNHTTGLQNLQFSPTGHHLFSTASCEEFFIWRLQPTPLVTIGIVCEAKCPPVSEERDLRIMDFAILPIFDENSSTEQEPSYLLSTIYSDSTLRVFKYHPSIKTFTLLAQGTYTTHCLTQITYFSIGNNLYLCTGSTDGYLAIWPSPNISANHLNDPTTSPLPQPLTPTTRIRTHQSSIKALLSIPLPSLPYNSTTHLLITAGDDGAISLALLAPPHPTITSRLLIPKAHASAITSLSHLPTPKSEHDAEPINANSNPTYHIASVGSDQRVKIWAVTLTPNTNPSQTTPLTLEINIKKESNIHTSVADAAVLESDTSSVNKDGIEKTNLWVAGVGMESFTFRHQSATRTIPFHKTYSTKTSGKS